MHLGEAAEALEKGLGQGFDVAPGQGREQDQFQQLVVGQGVRAALEQPFPQALPVTRVMRLARHGFITSRRVVCAARRGRG